MPVALLATGMLGSGSSSSNGPLVVLDGCSEMKGRASWRLDISTFTSF
jgi:hypothetical protein